MHRSKRPPSINLEREPVDVVDEGLNRGNLTHVSGMDAHSIVVFDETLAKSTISQFRNCQGASRTCRARA